jgi:hypothetical protein
MNGIVGVGRLKAGASSVAPRQRRERRPSVRALIKQAERAGKSVTAVTINGVTLSFGIQGIDETNEWDRDLFHGAH